MKPTHPVSLLPDFMCVFASCTSGSRSRFGAFGPVHTGSDYAIEVHRGLHLQWRRERDSHTSVLVPYRCVPPPRGTTTQPWPGTSFLVSQVFSCVLQVVPFSGADRLPVFRHAFLRQEPRQRFVMPYYFSGRGLGLPCGDTGCLQVSYRVTGSRFIVMAGLPGGFQAAVPYLDGPFISVGDTGLSFLIERGLRLAFFLNLGCSTVDPRRATDSKGSGTEPVFVRKNECGSKTRTCLSRGGCDRGSGRTRVRTCGSPPCLFCRHTAVVGLHLVCRGRSCL